ncbi:MAG: NAD(P)-binding protein [Candidatus Binataceae bacterium]
MARQLSVAIVRAGIGGLAAAATLLRAAREVNVYEQAHRFTRLDGGIQQSPTRRAYCVNWGLSHICGVSDSVRHNY